MFTARMASLAARINMKGRYNRVLLYMHTFKLDYNVRGYNKFPTITKKMWFIFWSQIITILPKCYNEVTAIKNEYIVPSLMFLITEFECRSIFAFHFLHGFELEIRWTVKSDWQILSVSIEVFSVVNLPAAISIHSDTEDLLPG